MLGEQYYTQDGVSIHRNNKYSEALNELKPDIRILRRLRGRRFHHPEDSVIVTQFDRSLAAYRLLYGARDVQSFFQTLAMPSVSTVLRHPIANKDAFEDPDFWSPNHIKRLKTDPKFRNLTPQQQVAVLKKEKAQAKKETPEEERNEEKKHQKSTQNQDNKETKSETS